MPMDLPPQAWPADEVQMVREAGGENRAWPLLLLAAAGELSAVGSAPSRDEGSASPSAPQYDIKLKVCEDVVGPNTKYRPDNLSSTNVISPEFEVVRRVLRPTPEEARDPITSGFQGRGAALRKDAVITIVQQPKHGKLLPVKSGEHSGYFYLANRGYFGKDKAVFSVKLNDGRSVLLEREISVIANLPHRDPCSTTKDQYRDWRKRDWDELKRGWDEGGVSTNDAEPILEEGVEQA